MSVFKRLGNVARGKMMELGRTLDGSPGGDEPDELDPDRPLRPPVARPPDAARPAGVEEKRAMLARLLEEGLLTEEEYEAKHAALEVPVSSQPRKRHL